jgi:hypothetical protein
MRSTILFKWEANNLASIARIKMDIERMDEVMEPYFDPEKFE